MNEPESKLTWKTKDDHMLAKFTTHTSVLRGDDQVFFSPTFSFLIDLKTTSLMHLDRLTARQKMGRETWAFCSIKDLKMFLSCFLFSLPPALRLSLSLTHTHTHTHTEFTTLHPKQMCWNANTQRSSHETSWQTHTHTHTHTHTVSCTCAYPIFSLFVSLSPSSSLSSASLISHRLVSLSSRLYSPSHKHFDTTECDNRGDIQEKIQLNTI